MRKNFYLYNKRDIGQSYKNKNYFEKVTDTVVHDGFILPLKGNKGGVLNKNEEFVQASFHDGEWFKYGGSYTFPRSSLEYIDENVVYLGVFIKQWGHFLLDSLSRCWFLNKGSLKNIKFAFISTQDTIDGNYLKVMNLLGIKEDDLLIVKKPTKFNKIIVPEMCVTSNRGYTKEYPEIFQRIVSNAKIDSYNVPKKVYLSRTKLKIAHKKEFGEEIIENAFRINGYTIMYPEKLSLLEQIAIFNKSEQIACLNGSIPFGIIFSSPKLKLTILNKTSLPHYNLFELIGTSSIYPTFVDCYREPFKGLPLNLGEGPFLLVFSKELRDFFTDNNMKYKFPYKVKYLYSLLYYLPACLKAYMKLLYRKIIV